MGIIIIAYFWSLMFQKQFVAIKGAINQSSPSAEIARFHVLNFIDAPSKKALSGHCRVELCANCCLLLVGFLYCELEIEHPIKNYKNHWYQPIHSTDLVG